MCQSSALSALTTILASALHAIDHATRESYAAERIRADYCPDCPEMRLGSAQSALSTARVHLVAALKDANEAAARADKVSKPTTANPPAAPANPPVPVVAGPKSAPQVVAVVPVKVAVKCPACPYTYAEADKSKIGDKAPCFRCPRCAAGKNGKTVFLVEDKPVAPPVKTPVKTAEPSKPTTTVEPVKPAAADKTDPVPTVKPTAKPTAARTCKGTTKAGAPCKANCLSGTDYCRSHQPTTAKVESKPEAPEADNRQEKETADRAHRLESCKEAITALIAKFGTSIVQDAYEALVSEARKAA